MQDKIDTDIKLSLKDGDRIKADALRMLKNALINARIALGHDLTNEEALKVIRKEIKSRIEARDLYQKNNREDLAKKEEYERDLFTAYVPPELNDNELQKIIVESAKSVTGDLSIPSLMPLVMKKVAGRADGKKVSQAVKDFIDKETK
jgi:uncharacterized protein YqeY